MGNNIDKQSYEFWFDNPEFNEHGQFNADYYVNDFYKDIVFNLDIPEDGYIVVAGTNRCVSFELLCNKFGEERCIGFDLYNPYDHPRVTIKNCNGLGIDDNIPIAFAHNDIGSMSHTPSLKIYTQIWLAKNIVPGGVLMGNNNLNRAKFNFEGLMEMEGFENIQFSLLDNNKFDLSDYPHERIEGYMISVKKQ